MKRIIITGANGLLGEACCRLLSDDYEVVPLTRADVDLCDSEKLVEILDGMDFDFLINNAAISGLEQCLEHPEQAVLVNVTAPEMMAQVCQQKGARMLQVSTDYVIDGDENRIHDESSRTKESGVYAKTKLMAENTVMQHCEDSIIARVCWLFGYGRESFVDQVVNRALIGEPASYVGDKFSVPNFCDDLVPVMAELLESGLAGVVHLTNDAEPESWYSYAEKLLSIAGELGILEKHSNLIEKSKLEEISFFKEDRPRYTAMKPRRLTQELDVRVRNWECGVREYLSGKYGNSLTCK